MSDDAAFDVDRVMRGMKRTISKLEKAVDNAETKAYELYRNQRIPYWCYKAITESMKGEEMQDKNTCPKCGSGELRLKGYERGLDDPSRTVYEHMECICGFVWSNDYEYIQSMDSDGQVFDIEGVKE